ncbi:MAG: reverse transcriptase domain-containing protein, partial [Nitrospiraceae bacterium]
MAGTLGPEPISTRLQRVATLARQSPRMVLTTLSHHIDVEFLREAYRLTRKDAAAGVDGQTAATYAANLEENLQLLLERLKSGTYWAPPVRRVHIPKEKGKTRPIGIPTFEDKVLQRAVVMVLEAVYEQDFMDCSYGFRPRRSAHQALEALRDHLMSMHGGWVLEVDIQSFFDTLDHGHLRSFLDQRVRDGVLRRVIGKWLHAGVLENGWMHHPETGTPQGGVITPPTMLPKAPATGARHKRAWRKSKNDSHLLLSHLDTPHQGPNELATRHPVRVCEPLLDFLREVLDPSD